MPQTQLEVPLRRLRLELAWLHTEFCALAIGPASRQTQLGCEMTVIRMHDAWARFCRELIILSALGDVVTASGQTLSRSLPLIVSHASVIPVLLKIANRPWEPKWASSAECIRAAKQLQIQNLSNVSAALGAANSPADSLRKVRNYYAHRNQGTSDTALQTRSFQTSNHPDVFQLNGYISGGITVFDSWSQGLKAVAVAAIQ